MLSFYGWGISLEIAHRCLSQDFTDDKSTLVQVMVWCHQATNHYLSQCCPRSLSPYGITRLQWVNLQVIWHAMFLMWDHRNEYQHSNGWPSLKRVNPHLVTYWGRNEMATISQTLFPKCIILNEHFWISIEITFRCIPWYLVDKISSIVQIMAWRHIGDRPLSELMMV